MKQTGYLLIILMITIGACMPESSELKVSSPNETNELVFGLSDEGQPYYIVYHAGSPVIPVRP